MDKNARLPLLVLLLSWSLPLPGAAQDAPALDDGSDWTLEEPGRAAPGGGFSEPERIQFGEKMRRRVLDQLCRGLSLSAGENISAGDELSAGARIKRSLRIMPDERLALVDSQKLRLDAGYAEPLVTEAGGALGIRVGGGLLGTSLVVRPLAGRKSCSELGKLADVTGIKSVVPFTAARLMAMDEGELWRMPAAFTISHAEFLSAPLGGGAASAGIYFGTGQTGTALMTLYRLGPDRLRFRLRLGHVRIVSRGGQIAAELPAIRLFGGGDSVLEKALGRAAAREMSRFVKAGLDCFRAESDGQQMLMEFVLDPRSQVDMERLAGALRGDFMALIRMAKTMAALKANPERAQADFAGLESRNEALLRAKADRASIDLHRSMSKSLTARIPFFLDHARVFIEQGDDRVSPLGGEGGEVRLFRAGSSKNTGWIDVPVKGVLYKHNIQRSVQAFVVKDKDGAVSEPQAVYIHQEGFLRRDAGKVRGMAAGLNSVMRLAGARGGPANPRLEVPLGALFPASAPDEKYHDGFIGLTVVLTQKAVAGILSAASDLLLRCFVNTLSAADRILMSAASVRSDGKVAVASATGDGARAARLCAVAARLLADVAEARSAQGPEARAQALTRLLAGRDQDDGRGKSRSRLAYEDVLKVLIQLVDPLDLTADLTMTIVKRVPGDPDVRSRFLLRNGRPDNPLLREASEAKSRFAQPSELVD